jgi:uncharacterized membrane protein YphA (DoxX/SURF4 family)
MTQTAEPARSDSADAAAAAPSRGRNIALWVLQVVLAAVYLFAGGMKLIDDPMQIAEFQKMGLGVVGMHVLGVLEIAAGVGLLLPGVAGFAATCLVALMVGAVISTALMMGATPLVAIPAVVLLLVAVVAWARRRRTAAFVRLALGR